MWGTIGMSAAQATFIHNPFDITDRDTAPVPLDQYPTVGSLCTPLAEAGSRNTVVVNGQVVAPEDWDSYQLTATDHLLVKPKVEFQFAGQLIGAMVGMAQTAAAFAPYGIPVGVAAMKLGFAVAGGYLMRALSPTPKMPHLRDIELGNSQVYSWNPMTLQQQGLPIPLNFGKFRAYGNVVSCHTYDNDDGDVQYGRAVVAMGEGPIESFVSGSCELESQPIALFPDVSIETKTGEYNQTASALASPVKPEYRYQAEVTYDDGTVTRVLPDDDADDLEITLLFPRGIFWIDDMGGTSTHSINVTVKIREEGGAWSTLASETVSKNTTQAYRKTYVASETYSGGSPVTIAQGTKYEVSVQKNTADQSASRYGDIVYLESVREVLNDAFEYPGIAYAAIEGLDIAQLSSGLDISWEIEGLVLPTYNGSSWTIQYSNCPAWVIYYLLTLPIIKGDGVSVPYEIVGYKGLQPSQVDLTKLYELAVYCDTLVPDGKGGTEKRIEINRGFDTRTTIWEAVLEVCQVARCSPVLIGNKVSLAINKPKTAVQVFNVDNTNLDSFKRTFLPIYDRITELEVIYNDAEKGYKRTILPLIDTAADASQYNKTTLELIGCTRESQAWREALIKLNMNRLQKCQIELGVDVEALGCTVGDCIKIQSSIPLWGEHVRVSSATSNTVTLLDNIETTTSDDQICIRTVDETNEEEEIETFDVLSVADNVVTIDGTWSNTPVEGNTGFYGASKYVTKNFVIYHLERTSNMEAVIHAVDYYSDIFTDDVETPVIAYQNYDVPSVADKVVKPLSIQDVRNEYPREVVADLISTDTPMRSGFTWTDNSPSAGHVAWSEGTLLLEGDTYTIAAGSTNYPFLYWDKNSANTTFQGTATLLDTVGAGRFPVALNKNGTLVLLVPDAATYGDMVVPDTLSVDNLAEGSSYKRYAVADQTKLSGVETGADVTRDHADEISYIGPSAPGSPRTGYMWLDTSTSPDTLKRYNGATWDDIGTVHASWSNVLDDGAKPENNATVGATWNVDIANQPDHLFQTFFQDSEPGSDMDTGDYWFDTNDGNKLYRYSGAAWVEIQDADIAQALSDAADAQSTADGKVVTFVQTSAPTAEGAGDLWLDSDDGYRMYRWSGSAWVDVRDSGIAQAITAAAGAQGTADGKVTTFYQSGTPTAEGAGDLWVDTGNGNLLKRWSGSAWTAVQDADVSTAITNAATAQSTADGKIVTFIQASAPTADGTGDIWIDSDDDNKPYRWSGSAWTAIGYDVATWSKVAGTGKPDDNADVTAAHAVDITHVGGTAPSTPQAGWIWLDTSTNPDTLKRYSGSAWATVSTVGSLWSQVVDDGNAPANNATDNSSWAHASDTAKMDGGMIYAASIVAGILASNAVVADNINVASLSAISADLGSCTAGSYEVTTAGSRKWKWGPSGIQITNDGSTWLNILYDTGSEIVLNADYIKTGTLEADRVDTNTINGISAGFYRVLTSDAGIETGYSVTNNYTDDIIYTSETITLTDDSYISGTISVLPVSYYGTYYGVGVKLKIYNDSNVLQTTITKYTTDYSSWAWETETFDYQVSADDGYYVVFTMNAAHSNNVFSGKWSVNFNKFDSAAITK